MKIFYSAEDIENFAEKGQREIYVDENTVMTDLAVHTAQMLGLRVVEKSAGPPRADSTGAPTQTKARTNQQLAKPKCCRPGIGAASGQKAPQAGKASQPVVEQLVKAVKNLNGR